MDDATLKHTAALLASTREELVRADAKASLLLASAGVAVGAVLAAILAGSWRPSALADAVEWLWWLGALVVSTGLAALGVAVYPRTRTPGPRPATIAYFGDVLAADQASLAQRLDAAPSSKEALIDQLWNVSMIVKRKYLAIQYSLWAMASGLVACVLAAVVSGAMH